MSAQVAADLRAAAALLSWHGWAQGGLSEDGRLCAVEAIQRATPGPDEACDAVLALHAQVGPVPNIATWNDEDGRTADEVIAALRAAADAAESEDGTR